MKKLLMITLILMPFLVASQDKGYLKGKVLDGQSNDPIPFANVSLIQDGNQIVGVTTDFNGEFSFSKIDTGTYDLELAYVGYQKKLIEGLKIKAGETTEVSYQMEQGLALQEVMIIEYSQPMMEYDRTASEVNNVKRKGDLQQINGIRVINPGFNYDNANEDYQEFSDNQFQSPLSQPLSTFSADVDRASYANTRRYLKDGELPPQDAVRIEELINYFDYDYPEPQGEHPFSITTEFAECPWNPQRKLAMIGLQAKRMELGETPPNNLVFLLDVSGSMNSYDKLGLLKQGMDLLVDQMREEDHISIVVYAGAAGLVLDPTSGADKAKIKAAIDQLSAGGSTAGGAGIQLAYDVAEKNFKKDGNNRIILATDGDFNVGVSNRKELTEMIEKKREGGVFLSVLGFGTGNIKDHTMEQLANKGNGNYNYIDNLLEAKKVLVKEMSGTLVTVAKDVKLQAEFNPAKVIGYRLIGYVNRQLDDRDFNDDTKDAGELGAGHSVTALYEIIPIGTEEDFIRVDTLKYQKQLAVAEQGSENEILTVKFRYKKPDGQKSILLESVMEDVDVPFTKASDNFRFSASVAAFGMKLRGSQSVRAIEYEQIMELARAAKGEDVEGYRSEFIQLVETAQLIKRGEK